MSKEDAIKKVKEALDKARDERERLGAKVQLKRRIKLIRNKRAYQ